MKPGDTLKLDNPVWFSLHEMHGPFSIAYGSLKCYDPDYCPFGGCEKETAISDQLSEYAAIANEFFIVGEKPSYKNDLVLKKELVCQQMVIEHEIDLPINESIVKLNNNYEEELFSLVNLIQPGYFKAKTSLLGDYYGIFKNEILVSVTGERMKMDKFTEVSAIVTHPDHTGNGYASQLIAYVVNKIFMQNKIPYLHVSETNTGAIKLYEKCGFSTRRKISFWNFTKEILNSEF